MPPRQEGYLVREAPDQAIVERKRWFFRHPAVIRVTHWINALCLALLLMSGLQIFNAYPALDWGNVSTFDRSLLSIESIDVDTDHPKGVTRILGAALPTTGVLGLSFDESGAAQQRAFPSWLTLPGEQDLATGRRWHFFFAWVFVLNGALYLLYGLVSGHLRFRIIPSRDQIRDVWGSVREHLTLHFPEGDEAKRYNVIQKLAYFVVIVLLLPLQVLAGLAMSPGMNAAAPWLLSLLGGRQSARTIHFVVANLLVIFVAVHVVMVLVSGVWNNMRSMITGWFVIERTRIDDHPTA